MFFLLNMFLTRFLMDFGLLGASKRVPKSQVRGVKTPSSSVLNAKTPSRPYCRVKDSPQEAFQTLFRHPKPASWPHFQALVRGNHFGMSTSLRPLSHHHLEARWRKLRSIRIRRPLQGARALNDFFQPISA